MEKTAKIFLVEDEAITALFMRHQLKSVGIEIIKTFSNGEDLIFHVENEQPDLLIMDINLSGEIDGVETAKKINSVYDVPVIFISGYSDAEVRDRIIEFKPAAFFIKPVNILGLKEAIDDVILGKQKLLMRSI